MTAARVLEAVDGEMDIDGMGVPGGETGAGVPVGEGRAMRGVPVLVPVMVMAAVMVPVRVPVIVTVPVLVEVGAAVFE
jgi:hypothetical protein